MRVIMCGFALLTSVGCGTSVKVTPASVTTSKCYQVCMKRKLGIWARSEAHEICENRVMMGQCMEELK